MRRLQQQHDDRAECHRISRRDAPQERLQEPCHGPRRGPAEHHPCRGQQDAGHDDHAHRLTGGGAEREPDPELTRPLGDQRSRRAVREEECCSSSNAMRCAAMVGRPSNPRSLTRPAVTLRGSQSFVHGELDILVDIDRAAPFKAADLLLHEVGNRLPMRAHHEVNLRVTRIEQARTEQNLT